MLLIVQVFAYRHFWQDKGRFPARMKEDMELEPSASRRRGVRDLLPYGALVLAVAVVWIAHRLAYGSH
jgi:hypothetical protein